jgi:hypothetical protein
MSQKMPSQKQAQKLLWSKGVLRWKLTPVQKTIYDKFYSSDDYVTTVLASRQLGKSFAMCVLAVETCLRTPNAVVKYACPKQKMVKTILKATMRQILEDCPEEIMPEYKEADKLYVFKNGSEIQMAGCDNQNYDSIRGGRAHLWIVDEAGFCDDLEIVVRSVLSPTTTTTRGKGLLASTPDPHNLDHDFIKKFVEPASFDKTLHKYTIYDNSLITDEDREKIIRQYPGGVTNPLFRAEYMCEIVKSAEISVIPEFDDEAEKKLVQEYPRPAWFDTYVSMDIGGKDFTAVLFGYFDFSKKKVIIEDEFVMKGKQNSQVIAEGIKRKIRELWQEKPVYLMYADNNNVILLNDLSIYHDLHFIPTKKDNKEAAVNQLRLLVANEELIISPRCKTLIAHLKNAAWAKNSRNDGSFRVFARSVAFSHFDFVDAALYMVRNIRYSKNPYPKGYGLLAGENSYTREVENSEYSVFSDMLKARSSFKRRE